LSDATVDDIAGLAPGHTGKLLGPSCITGLGRITLDSLLGALAQKIIVVANTEAMKRVAGRWERRNPTYLHPSARVAKSAIARAAPVVMAELARKGAAARLARMTPEQRKTHIELMNLGRAVKRLAGKTEAA
jgi:hypothetical protein